MVRTRAAMLMGRPRDRGSARGGTPASSSAEPEPDKGHTVFRARSTEKLVRTRPCIWSASAQVTRLSPASTFDPCKCKEARPRSIMLRLRVHSPFHPDIYFKVKKSMVLQRLFDAFCERAGVEPSLIDFRMQEGGPLLDGRISPDSIGLEDGDIIYAVPSPDPPT